MKTYLTLKKMPQKVSQRFIVVSFVLDNIALPESDHAKCIICPLFAHFVALSLVFGLICYIYSVIHVHTPQSNVSYGIQDGGSKWPPNLE